MAEKKKPDAETMMVVELIDEDGKGVEFEHLMTLEHDGLNYIVLLPLDEVEGVDENEVMIMQIEEKEDEDVYLPVENEITLNEVFEIFLETIEDEEDIEEE